MPEHLKKIVLPLADGGRQEIEIDDHGERFGELEARMKQEVESEYATAVFNNFLTFRPYSLTPSDTIPQSIYYCWESGTFIGKSTRYYSGGSTTTYYSSWNGSHRFGTPSDNGVVPVSGKIYIDLSIGAHYHWNGTTLVAGTNEISRQVSELQKSHEALGESVNDITNNRLPWVGTIDEFGALGELRAGRLYAVTGAGTSGLLYAGNDRIYPPQERRFSIKGQFVSSSAASDRKYYMAGYNSRTNVIPTSSDGSFDYTPDTAWPRRYDYLFYLNKQLSSLAITADTGLLTSCRSMFRCERLVSLDVKGMDTSNVTDMSYMLETAYALQQLDLSEWDVSKVTTMSGMFRYCTSLRSVNTDGWDTSNVTTFNGMFYECNRLTSLDLSGWDTSSLTDTWAMFQNCKALTSLNLSGWDTSHVVNMGAMFYGLWAMPSLDVTGFDTSKVDQFHAMFKECRKLTVLDVTGFDTSGAGGMSWMFYDCRSLKSLDLSGWNVSRVKDMSNMFRSCTALASLQLGRWEMGNLGTQYAGLTDTFYGCTALRDVSGTLSGINTNLSLGDSPLTNASAMVFIRGLAEVTAARTITFSAATYDTLTEEQIALATSKGWTVAKK